MSTSVTLIGATGLIGRHCLELLLEDDAIDHVNVICRRPLPAPFDSEHPKLKVHITSFSQLHTAAQGFRSDALICCLGTTRKQAGSRAAFRKVDFDYVLKAAHLAHIAGAKRMAVISAVGASASSPLFYNKVKGRMEAALQHIQFEGLYILRPSLLLGERGEKRWAEDLSKPLTRALSPLMINGLRRYRPIEGREVARQMVELCKAAQSGLHIIYPSQHQ